jgi:HupE / UreJ protein
MTGAGATGTAGVTGRSAARALARRWAVALFSLTVLAVLMLSSAGARAHQLDSASLSLTEVGGGRFVVRWQASSRTLEDDLATAVVFPKACRLEGGRLDCGASGLVGSLEFPWIEGTMTRVVVDVQWMNGSRLLRVASPSSPSLRIYGAPTSGWRALQPVVVDYTKLGIEHILTGFDHLLFVIALVFLVRGRGQLLATITAFTVAHSLSLAATVLGLVHVPSLPVEASIALSIVLVCAECLRGNHLHPGQTGESGEGSRTLPRRTPPSEAYASLTRRAPWAVAFAFGLLHGLGFASALLELGVPEQHLPAALFCFNVGVELGQLAVVALVIGLRRLATRLRINRDWMRSGLVYAMGSLAAYWSIDRIGAVFSAGLGAGLGR